MAIYKGSRYEYSTVDFVAKTPNGDQNPIVFYSISDFTAVSYYEHTYITGERLDQISVKYYKTPSLWWLIPEFNPQLVDFTNIPTGTVLRIPNV
jgi:nucleoid-associated protein YgaU